MTRSYRIENLDCADCAARLERGLKGIAWISSATVNFAAATLTVDTERHERIGEDVRGLEPGLLVTPRQEAAVKRSGSADDRPAKGKKPGPAAILVAAGAAYAAALAAGFAFPSESPPFSAVRAAVLIAVWIVSGRSVVRKAFSNVLKGRPMDEHFLMTLASAAAFALGAFSEAAGVMLFYAAGELLQSAAVRKSRNAITGLISLSPERARREGSSGIEWIAVEEIVPGDILSVGPGERVPVDARLESGWTSLDSSAMTGESRPVAAGPGDEVRAGSLNLDASIRALALRPASESYIARMLSLVEEASGRKARTERFFTAFARIYTPIVVLAALATAVAPPLLLAGAAWGDWIYRALTLLIVSCPCALVISVPLAYFAGIGRGAREGILFKGSDSIDSLAAVGTIVFDKTGTLTSGEFAVRGAIPAPGKEMAALLEAALSVEAESTHPIGKSIVAWIDSERPELKARPSAGRAVVGGRGTKVWGEGFSLLAGNAEFMSEEGVDGFVPPEGRTDGMLAGATGRESEGEGEGISVHLALNGSYLGRILLADALRTEAGEAIGSLRRVGIGKIHMLSGDASAAAGRVATELGLDGFEAPLKPDEKLAALERIMASQKARSGRRRKTAFAGDGINDAPSLARADVGISFGSGATRAAMEASDLAIAESDLRLLPEAIRLARRTRAVLYSNVALALGCKLILIATGLSGLTGIWEAVLGDVGVTLLAVLNSARLIGRSKRI